MSSTLILNIKDKAAMVSGKGKLDRIENDRYPQIHPMTVKQFLSKGNS